MCGHNTKKPVGFLNTHGFFDKKFKKTGDTACSWWVAVAQFGV